VPKGKTLTAHIHTHSTGIIKLLTGMKLCCQWPSCVEQFNCSHTIPISHWTSWETTWQFYKNGNLAHWLLYRLFQ